MACSSILVISPARKSATTPRQIDGLIMTRKVSVPTMIVPLMVLLDDMERKESDRHLGYICCEDADI